MSQPAHTGHCKGPGDPRVPVTALPCLSPLCHAHHPAFGAGKDAGSHRHCSARSQAPRVWLSPPSPNSSTLPTTLGNFWRRRGMRGSFMPIRLKRPHKHLGGFLAAAGSWLELQEKVMAPSEKHWPWSRSGDSLHGLRAQGCCKCKGFWGTARGGLGQGGAQGTVGQGPAGAAAPRRRARG